ncbi:MAG TPA: hypothetical protein VMS64_09800 [Candidatus Methylomirabilis sp.]|nr:hypothetical protein [Candidatus Methylomirabilis sp.]
MVRFAAGVLVGGIMVWLWGDKVRHYADNRTRDIREKAANTLHSVQGKADDVFDTAKDRVHATLQAGRDALRPHIASVR